MEKEITIGEKKFKVRELLARELDDVDWSDTKSLLKKQVMVSTGLTEEEYNTLTLKERLVLVKTINEVNGLDDFLPEKKNLIT